MMKSKQYKQWAASQLTRLRKARAVLTEIELCAKDPLRQLNPFNEDTKLDSFLRKKTMQLSRQTAMHYDLLSPSNDPQSWHYKQNVYNVLYDPARLRIAPFVDELMTMLYQMGIDEDDELENEDDIASDDLLNL